ncbi:MAG: ParB N-terminal domain-containing protein [Alphaproteobacteria bacterium]|nr:ParB N-terminal domain-containing protein [Alphaproteobacteria bacterium]
MWRHNSAHAMNEQNCADLIESIRAQGRQEVPAIVRQVSDDPRYSYEVICGSGRDHRTGRLEMRPIPERIGSARLRSGRRPRSVRSARERGMAHRYGLPQIRRFSRPAGASISMTSGSGVDQLIQGVRIVGASCADPHPARARNTRLARRASHARLVFSGSKLPSCEAASGRATCRCAPPAFRCGQWAGRRRR